MTKKPSTGERTAEAELDLEPIRQRIVGAAPAPWEVDSVDGDGMPPWILRDRGRFALAELIANMETHEFIAHARTDIPALIAEVERLRAALRSQPEGKEPEEVVDVQLLAWAVSNCHTLARRRIKAGFDLDYWEHVQRICEKAGARSAGVLRASLPTEITEGSSALREAANPPGQGAECNQCGAKSWDYDNGTDWRCPRPEGSCDGTMQLVTANPPATEDAPPREYTRVDSEAAAWREIARRLDDAHAYCHVNNLRLGLNVWHAILDDAIQLRAALASPRDPQEGQP